MVSTGDTTTNNTLIQIGIVDTDNTATDINDMINNITYTVIDSPDDDDDTNQ
jgi:hypothetical protein